MASLEELTPNQIEKLHQLTEALTNNPETRNDYLRLLKKVSPSMSIPEIDATDSLRKELSLEREARVKLESSIKEDQIKRNLEASRLSVKNRHSLSEDQLASVEKLMVDKQIHDYDVAAEFYSLQNQAADPSGGRSVVHDIQPRDFAMPTEAWKGVDATNRHTIGKVARSEAIKALNEIRKQHRST